MRQAARPTLAPALALLLAACATTGRPRGRTDTHLDVPRLGARQARGAHPGGSGHQPIEVALSSDRLCLRVGGRVTCSSGDDRTGPLLERAPLPGIDDAIAMSAGNATVCVARASGTTACFGRNEGGLLGPGVTERWSESPVTVRGLRGARSLAVADGHACALTGDGGVHCWGRNERGQTSADTRYAGTVADLAPVTPVALPDRAVQIAAAAGATCARRASGEVVCWGEASLVAPGAAGAGAAAHLYPRALGEIARVDDLTGGGDALCAISRGEVLCWGGAHWLSKSDVTRIAVPSSSRVRFGVYHGCALGVDARVYCWGTASMLGARPAPGTEEALVSVPQAVPDLPPIVDLAASTAMTCAVAEGERVFCWGTWPRSTDSNRPPRYEPVPVELRLR